MAASAAANLIATTADGLVTDVLKRIGVTGATAAGDQVAGIGWSVAEASATLASNGGDSGRRGCARRRSSGSMSSDTLARVSDVPALQVSDVEATAHVGTLTIRASNGPARAVRLLAAPSVAAVQRYLESRLQHHRRCPVPVDPARAAGSPAGRLGADSIRAIYLKRAAVDGIAQADRRAHAPCRLGREFAADGASVAELRQAGGWCSSTTPAVYVRRESATRAGGRPSAYGAGQ